MSNKQTFDTSNIQLIVALCLLVFFNISCFTIITSFTKSNFLSAVQASTLFEEVYNQKPYFFLYGFSGTCFVVFYLVYHSLIRKTSFEERIKHDILYLIICSSILYFVPFIFPDFHKKFFPASVYFVVYDILDDLIIVQTWTLINYSLNIRESKKVQNLFLFSGGVAAFVSGQYIISSVPGNRQTFFLIIIVLLSCLSYAIVAYIFHNHRNRILATISAEKVGLKGLLDSQKRYRVIKSIIIITVLIGVFNLFFKVLFDTQINARYPVYSENSAQTGLQKEQSENTVPAALSERPDPKTQFIGKYKAFISLLQVGLQLMFIYFFAKLWLNGRILFSYPLLLIPNILFILWVYFMRTPGRESLLFWGTVTACGVNELIRRVIFDSAYQLLMFSIPERLCNALRMYTRLFIKPVVVIFICIFFVLIPVQKSPIPLYCGLLLSLLITMIFIVGQIPGAYVSSLKSSVLRRISIERTSGSLITHETNYILDQYRKVIAESNDRFGNLYLLNIIKSNYSAELDFILAELVNSSDPDVRLETVSVINSTGARKLVPDLEALLSTETDFRIKELVLRTFAEWGPPSQAFLNDWMERHLPPDLRKYVLAITYQNAPGNLQESIIHEVTEFIDSTDTDNVRAGIWLIGELHLYRISDKIKKHFNINEQGLYPHILQAAAKLGDFDLFTSYVLFMGHDKIFDYEVFNRTLATFGEKSFEFVSNLITTITQSKYNPDIGKFLQTFQFIPTQNAVDFLVNIYSSSEIPLIRKEALNCLAKIGKARPYLNFNTLLEGLPYDIECCWKYCRYYDSVFSSDPDSLLLIELARNIEHEIWIIFKMLDMFYPDLAIFDSYYRITQASKSYGEEGHTKAKSIEYLESLIKDVHSDFLHLLETISFEDNFFSGIAPLPLRSLSAKEVYLNVIEHSNYWLRVAALIDMPDLLNKTSKSDSKELEKMIPVLEKIQFLKKVPLFKGFSIMELYIIAQITGEEGYESGYRLFKIGDPGDALYILLEGTVNIVDAKGNHLNTLGPPQCFGEIAVLDKAGRAATAICSEPCRMLIISSNDFHEILEKYPVLYRNIIHILTSWLRKDSGHSKKL